MMWKEYRGKVFYKETWFEGNEVVDADEAVMEFAINAKDEKEAVEKILEKLPKADADSVLEKEVIEIFEGIEGVNFTEQEADNLNYKGWTWL